MRYILVRMYICLFECLFESYIRAVRGRIRSLAVARRAAQVIANLMSSALQYLVGGDGGVSSRDGATSCLTVFPGHYCPLYRSVLSILDTCNKDYLY